MVGKKLDGGRVWIGYWRDLPTRSGTGTLSGPLLTFSVILEFTGTGESGGGVWSTTSPLGLSEGTRFCVTCSCLLWACPSAFADCMPRKSGILISTTVGDGGGPAKRPARPQPASG